MSEPLVLTIAIVSIVIIAVGAFLLSRRFTGNEKISSSLTVPERFARLLVAEIALYHRSKLDNARSHMAIYRLLKADIDRSRKMFLEKFRESESVWYAALVAGLANGQPERLGSDYPYPRAPC